jgi:hypothetical protein
MGRWTFLALVLGACTFPDVDYADGGAGGSASTSVSGGGGSTSGTGGSGGSTTTSGSGACPAPTSCANQATVCAAAATKAHDMCVKHCKASMPECPPQCDAELATALGICSAKCVSCAGADCGSAPTNCDALVGL